MNTSQQASKSVGIGSLRDKTDFVVKLDNISFPDYYSAGYLEAYAHTFPDQIIRVSKVQRAGFNTVYIYYYSENLGCSNTYVKAPSTLSVSLASEEEAKIVQESYLSWSERNLWETLHFDKTMYIGCDPEIFALDESGKLIPAWNFLGSKENPNRTHAIALGNGGHQIPSTVGNNPCYWDGFGAEFTTKPTTCLEYQVESIYCGLKGVRDLLKSKFPNAELTIKSVMDIDPKLMMEASDEQTEFGCSPSYNAYGRTIDLPPGRQVPFRSSGGHIHFGIGLTSHEAAIPMVKALDAILGVCCVSLFEKYDDTRRREYYGAPGEYRIPSHGIEYRPLSNAWLMHPFITNLVFDLGRKTLILGHKGLFTKMWKGTEQEVIDCMVASDAVKARELMDRNKPLILALLNAAYSQFRDTKGAAETLFDIFYKGVDSRIADPFNLEKNWALNTHWSELYSSREYSVKKHLPMMIANPDHKI